MKISDIYSYLDQIAPFDTALSFDNCGILVGDPEAEVTTCLVCLDVTNAVIDEAVAVGAELILSHHPVIFEGLKQLPANSIPARLLRQKRTVLSAHTNLDFAACGVNYRLAEACGLMLDALTRIPSEPAAQADGFGLCGKLPQPLSAPDFAASVKAALGAESVKCTLGEKPIRTVAVSCGSGGYLLEEVLNADVDAMVTGEIKHHQFLLAQEAGLTLIDAGHFETEQIVLSPLCEALRKAFPTVRFLVSEAGKSPVTYL